MAALALLTASTQAQSIRKTANNTNAWFMYFGTHKFAQKWSLHAEVQVRRSDFVRGWQQLLLRPGINYHFNSHAMATVGYCFVESWPYGELPSKAKFPENRFWEQLQFKIQTGKAEWINRLRLEQRFVKSPVQQPDDTYAPGDAVYTNRVRIMNRVSVPFKGQKIAPKSFYITAYDEVWVSFGKNVQLNVFDQNRAYLALGYSIPKLGRLEVGYLNQLILRSNGLDLESNHTLMVGLASNISLVKSK